MARLVSQRLLRRDTVSEPAEGEWLASSEPVITLRPPLAMTEVELEVDRDAMIDRGIRVGVVEVRSRVMGEAETRRAAVLRVTDAESVITLSAIHDPTAEPGVRITWIAMTIWLAMWPPSSVSGLSLIGPTSTKS